MVPPSPKKNFSQSVEGLGWWVFWSDNVITNYKNTGNSMNKRKLGKPLFWSETHSPRTFHWLRKVFLGGVLEECQPTSFILSPTKCSAIQMSKNFQHVLSPIFICRFEKVLFAPNQQFSTKTSNELRKASFKIFFSTWMCVWKLRFLSYFQNLKFFFAI